MRVRWNTYGINVLRESDIKRKIELNQIKRQTEILSTFMPDEILQMPQISLNEIHTYVGVLLFADVSGFTPLCEKYNKTGKGGIYRLTATLNAYIGALVEVITFYGGDILKFSGDAFLALWKAPPELRLYEVIHKVIVCALFIQNTLGCLETEVNVDLKVKLAIACGNLTFSVIGNENYRHYVIIGQAIYDVKGAEHVSVSGDVVVAPSAWGHLSEENYVFTYEPDGNVKVWNCIYSPNQNHLKQSYAKKAPIARTLVAKHLEHRSQLHEKRRIDDATTDSKITEEFISNLPERPSVIRASTKWIPNELNPFIVRPVQSQVEEKQPIEYLTEMREVTIQFINIVPTTFQDNNKLVSLVNKAYQIVCRIVSERKGVVNKVSLFDKDCMILVLFGLRGIEHEVEAQNALKSAFAIRKAIRKITTVKSVSVGVTNGLVYCGVVGHPFRREYTVIGGAVNKAARIMCAYEGKVTCDHETYKNCKLSSLYFQVQSVMKLKGIADAGYIFEYNEEFDKRKVEEQAAIPLIGREKEIYMCEAIIKGVDPEYSSLCIRGESKVGKTKLLQELYQRYGTDKKIICSFVLNEGLQRSHYTVATIYRQLYNALCDHNATLVKDLPRMLWDINDMAQSPKRSLENTSTVTSIDSGIETSNAAFVQLCMQVAPVPVYIDNFQFIDIRSFDVIESCVKKKIIKLICSGCFEDTITWTIMWRLSMLSDIKILVLEPMPLVEVSYLICNFLHVEGISKKLIILINKTCEGRPGWVQACLLKMVNNGELEVKYALKTEEKYAFLKETVDKPLVLVAGFSRKYLERGEETSTAVTLDLFDSFSPYQQLIIKTAAVLGDIFTRTVLIVLLKYPNENMLAAAIQVLFEEEVFDCASKYVNSGGLQEKVNICMCFMEDDEYENLSIDFPKCAYCKLLHFKSRNIKTLAYELLPQNQKKELHLRITDLLENQNHLCPACLHDNSASIISIERFRTVIKYCQGQKVVFTEKDKEIYSPIEEYKQIVRSFLLNPSKRHHHNNKVVEVPRRKVWDPTVCFCLEILLKVYKDLIRHSHCGQHFGKKIFFMLQYSLLLGLVTDYDEAIPILQEASEICMIQMNKTYVFSENFKTLMLGRIHCYLGKMNLNLGNIEAAKNHTFLSLRQYNLPIVSFKYSLPHLLLNEWWFFQYKQNFRNNETMNNSILQNDFGMCMCLISHIYVEEGCWLLAKKAASRAITCLKRNNPNLDVLCDVFTSAVYLFGYGGDLNFCEKLERYFAKESLKYYANNVTVNLYYLSRLLTVFFQVKFMSGNIIEAIALGYRSLSLIWDTQNIRLLLEMVPLLVSMLLKVQRISEAVHLINILRNKAAQHVFYSNAGYYAFGVEILLETNFSVISIEAIESYVNQSEFHKIGVGDYNKLLIGLYCYYLRYNPKKAEHWAQKHHIRNLKLGNHIIELIAVARYVECLLLERVRFKSEREATRNEDERWFNRFRDMHKKWPFFKPRYLHLKAYQYRIAGKFSSSMKYLKKAHKAAVDQANVLEQCWTMLHSRTWFGAYSAERKVTKHLTWETCRMYSFVEWCQVMYPLPVE